MNKRLLIAAILFSTTFLACQKEKSIAVYGVSLNLSSASLTMGNSLILTADVLPRNATNQTVLWRSDNSAKATVTPTGSLTAEVTMPANATVGFVDITVYTEDGNFEATCEVMVSTLHSDGSWYAYQTHTVGPGIDLVFMGDAYSASDITGGKYEEDMHTAIEGFFDIQPYKAYRDYFNVYIVEAESGESQLESGVQKDTKFSTYYDTSLGYRTNLDLCLTFAQKAPIKDIVNTVVVLVVNTKQVISGTCLYDLLTGKAVAVCPTSPDYFIRIVQRDAGGIGFGKLAHEYYTNGAVATQSQHDLLKSYHAHGYFTNVDLTGDLTNVLWKDFIGHPKYSMVGAFEGALTYETGLWRSEENSIMTSYFISYYNAPSRAAIVKRIRALAGESFSMEWFMSTDIIEYPVSTKTSIDHLSEPPHVPPIWIPLCLY